MTVPNLSRRGFALGGVAGLTGIALPVFSGGCGGPRDPIAAKLPGEPIVAGPLDQFAAAGVYDTLRAHNIWLYCDGSFLFALAAVCPHQYCIVKWDQDTAVYVCPCHRSRFGPEGLVRTGSQSSRALERCRIKAVPSENQVMVQVDPTIRYRQEQHQWSAPQSMVVLADHLVRAAR